MADLKMSWNGNSKGSGKIEADNLETSIAIPKALGGSGQGTDPKELLVASAATCYAETLVYMLDTRGVPVEEFTMNSESTNSKEEGLKITHYPHITLAANATEQQNQSANRAIDSADKSCEVGNMLKKADTKIAVEGKVTYK